MPDPLDLVISPEIIITNSPAAAPAASPSAAPAAPPTASPAASAPAASAAEQPKPKPAYPPAADQPTQVGALGIRYDFNLGARLGLPGRTEGRWRARLRDLDTGNILFESENQGAVI